MKTVGVIPARFGSTRFPGKPLVPILGKPLLQWVIEGARTAKRIDEIRVATDHPEIADLARRLDVVAVMTPSDLPTGTDRVHYATRKDNFDIILNIQGDEPLITGDLLDRLVAPMKEDPSLEMATLGRSLQDGDLASPNTAKIVVNQQGHALYFSRQPLTPSLKHIGIYAYRGSFLTRFCAQPPVEMEKAERLEQLRALYLGATIRVVQVEHSSWGVDTPEDVAKVEAILRAQTIDATGKLPVS
ncbi:MAG: 3-deoxy-manno-octulosonate cytidylyltransferase [Bdellovibrionales bacterium]